jgi:hypothetical protein
MCGTQTGSFSAFEGETGAKMTFRISEFWDKTLNRPSSLGIGVTVWAIMLGGVYASVQMGASHVSADHAYVEHEPAVTASIKQRYQGPVKTAAAETATATNAVSVAAVTLPERPHSIAPTVQAENIPIPAARPVTPSAKALPLVAENSVPAPTADRYQEQTAMNAPVSPEEAASLPFDESPVVEGRVEDGMPIISGLKHLAAQTLRPLDFLRAPFGHHDEEAMLTGTAPQIR